MKHGNWEVCEDCIKGRVEFAFFRAGKRVQAYFLAPREALEFARQMDAASRSLIHKLEEDRKWPG